MTVERNHTQFRDFQIRIFKKQIISDKKQIKEVAHCEGAARDILVSLDKKPRESEGPCVTVY